jgi:hypothetical protein
MADLPGENSTVFPPAFTTMANPVAVGRAHGLALSLEADRRADPGRVCEELLLFLESRDEVGASIDDRVVGLGRGRDEVEVLFRSGAMLHPDHPALAPGSDRGCVFTKLECLI